MNNARIPVLAVAMALAATALVPTTASAQITVELISAPTVLNMPRGARNLGMGTTGAAEMNTLTTGLYNPASLAWIDATFFSGSTYDQQIGTVPVGVSVSDVGLSTGYVQGIGDEPGFRFGATVRRAGHTVNATATTRTIFIPGVGSAVDFEFEDIAISGGGAIAWENRNISVGIGATVRHVRLTGSELSDPFSFDTGMIAAYTMHLGRSTLRPRFGASKLHGGDVTLQTSPLPTTANFDSESRLGFGLGFSTGESGGYYARGRQISGLSVSLDYDIVDSDNYAFGLEISILETLQLRYGTTDNVFFAGEVTDSYGMGVHWERERLVLQLDYAHVSTQAGDSFGEVAHNVLGGAIGLRLW